MATKVRRAWLVELKDPQSSERCIQDCKNLLRFGMDVVSKPGLTIMGLQNSGVHPFSLR